MKIRPRFIGMRKESPPVETLDGIRPTKREETKALFWSLNCFTKMNVEMTAIEEKNGVKNLKSVIWGFMIRMKSARRKCQAFSKVPDHIFPVNGSGIGKL